LGKRDVLDCLRLDGVSGRNSSATTGQARCCYTPRKSRAGRTYPIGRQPHDSRGDGVRRIHRPDRKRLRREQFTVLEDKKPQRIATFSADDAPCSIGLLFDNSGSMGRKIESARLAMAHLLEVLNPEDEVFLMTFADRPEPPGEFTSDFATLQNTILFAKPSGQTALIDAVYLAVQRMRAARHPRRAIVVISDGGDNNSRYGSRELLDYAMEADVQIHALGVKSLPYGTFLLDAIASASGGLSITVDKLKALDDAMNTIGLALHNQYLIGYYPPEKPHGAKWRKVQVKVTADDGRQRLRAYTRSGYFGPE
jgi:Ca-activated chloride channel homolog